MIILLILYALLGWLVGILINHAANILPQRESLLQWPTCAECQTRRPYLAWSALLATVSGHRACARCGHRAASLNRSLLVELITPALFLFLWWRYGFSQQLGLISLYTAILLLITITDLEHRLILNVVILPSIVIAILAAFFTPLSGFWKYGPACDSILHAVFTLLFSTPTSFWQVAFIGGAIGFLISFLAWLLATLLYGPGALGQGDVTLSTFLGLILGFPYILLTFLFTVFLGGIVPFLLLVTRRISRKSFIPYGPFLTISGWAMLIWGDEIWQFYFC